MREIEIPLNRETTGRQIERAIDRAIAGLGLTSTMRASLRSFPGSVHWHVKNGRQSGTLEITFWPKQRRAWFTIQSGRRAAWIDEFLKPLAKSIRGQKKVTSPASNDKA